jgi:thiol-disulfide isomerase/thioredoxin
MAASSSPSANPFLKPHSLVAGLLIALFAIGTIFLTRPQTPVSSLSPVAGLMSLKAMAQTATPYDQAMANPQPTLIEFYADWCTTCQALAPTLATLHGEYGDRINFVMLNIDDPQWNPQIKQFQVSGVPHLALIGSENDLADTFIGKVPKSLLSQSLDTLLTRDYSQPS